MKNKLEALNEKTRQSVLLANLVKQSEFESDEGNLLITLGRITTSKLEDKMYGLIQNSVEVTPQNIVVKS